VLQPESCDPKVSGVEGVNKEPRHSCRAAKRNGKGRKQKKRRYPRSGTPNAPSSNQGAPASRRLLPCESVRHRKHRLHQSRSAGVPPASSMWFGATSQTPSPPIKERRRPAGFFHANRRGIANTVSSNQGAPASRRLLPCGSVRHRPRATATHTRATPSDIRAIGIYLETTSPYIQAIAPLTQTMPPYIQTIAPHTQTTPPYIQTMTARNQTITTEVSVTRQNTTTCAKLARW